jgi:V/A-type H+-transporting ATPase subunit K
MDIQTMIWLGAGVSVGLTGIGSAIGLTMAGRSSENAISEKPENFGMNLVFTVLAETPVIYGLLIALLLILSSKGIAAAVAGDVINQDSVLYGVLGASIAVGVTGLFSALGIGHAGASAIAALSEKREVFGKALVFVILPETVVIYGLLISLLTLKTIGVFGTPVLVTPESTLLFAGIVISIVGGTGYFLGRVGSTAIKTLVKRDDSFGKNIVFVVLVESIAIYGLLISILMLQSVNGL